MIVKKPFKHWGYWHWARYNQENALRLLQSRDVKLFLDNVFRKDSIVPNHLYQYNAGTKRVTELLENIDCEYEMVKSRFSVYEQYVNEKEKISNHQRVLKTILERDRNSLAMEIPVWGERNGQIIVGHIDLLAWEDEKLHVWDFKPNLKHERKKGELICQVWRYADLVCNLTRLKMKDVVLGLFDFQDEITLGHFD